MFGEVLVLPVEDIDLLAVFLFHILLLFLFPCVVALGLDQTFLQVFDVEMQIPHQLVLALLHFEQVLFVLGQFCYTLLQLCFFRFYSAHLVVFLPYRAFELGPGHDKGLVPLLEILPQSLDCLFFLFQFLEVLFHLADLVLLFADQFVPVLGLGPNRYEVFGPFLDVDGVVILFFIEFGDGILLV